MQRGTYWKIFALFLATISIAGCSLIPTRVVTETVYIERTIPIQQRPRSLELFPVRFYAVSETNIDDFQTRFILENGELTFIAMSVPHFENLSLNVAELRRYILQQQTLILFYERSVQNDNDK